MVGGCEFSRTFVYLVGWSWLFWYWLKSWLCCWGGYGSSDGGEIGGDSEVLMISLIKSPNSPKLQPSHQNSNPLTKTLTLSPRYLKSIDVIDLDDMKIHYFLIESWLSTNALNFIKAHPSGLQELYTFEALMENNVCRSFEDCNTWLSIVYCPTGSNFTRLQRLSRAMALLLGNMAITLMFFDKSLFQEIVTVGKIKLTMVGITTGELLIIQSFIR